MTEELAELLEAHYTLNQIAVPGEAMENTVWQCNYKGWNKWNWQA